LAATGTAACSDSSYGRDEINRSLLENFNDNSDNLTEKHDTYQVDFDTFKVVLDTMPQKIEIQQIDSI
jgi:PBP1b-binding outer membrane lipoprotein LpoB